MATRMSLLTVVVVCGFGVASSRTLPTANQLAYQHREVTMFIHFSMCTFAPNGGCEQDTACRTNPPSLFDPTGLNTTQWLETAAKLGAKEVCLTAHHTGGFALWQTNVTEYGVKESPYKGGKGDIVKEFTDSCKAFGISPCLYFINAWDCYESGDTAEVYVEKQLAMLSELAGGKYGHIDRFWFDQFGFSSRAGESPPGTFPAAWPKIVDHVHSVSPGTMMLPGPDGCLNPGEGGGGTYPVYNYVNDTTLCSYPKAAASEPSPNGQIYVPYESDISIQNPGDAWFYHEGHAFLNGAQLWDHYLDTVGRGSHFIINMPPNTTGVITDGFVQSATELGDAVRKSFGTNVGQKTNVSGPCSSFEVVVPVVGAAVFNAVMMQEQIELGQSILKYSLDLQMADGTWQPVTTALGQTVGEKLVDTLPNTTGSVAVRFRCTDAIGGTSATVSLTTISLHTLVPPVAPVEHGVLRSYFSESLNDTAPCAFRDQGSCGTYTTAKYTLVRDEAVVLSTRVDSDTETKWAHLTYSVQKSDNGLSDGLNPKFQPATYLDESVYEKLVVYTADAPGRVKLDCYFSDARNDFWILGSDMSRSEAVQRGYALVGTVGYGLAPNTTQN
eukprot:m.189831 g.189831  ORF g.189831 m.189831 type:complete len:612 (-) comp32388_c2_seq1:152-1987(-)